MNPRFAILLDGGFVVKILKKKLGVFPSAQHVVAETKRIRAIPELQGHDLLRVYYYDAPPSAEKLTNPLDKSVTDMAKSKVYKHRAELISDLELTTDFAVRKGEVKINGWKLGESALKDMLRNPSKHIVTAEDVQPDIQQKGVDLRIGLDMALLSLRQFVQTIVVVTADSDFIPAFKFARREGVRLFLDHLGAPVRPELKVHSDFVLPCE